jgi:hypothetical protein
MIRPLALCLLAVAMPLALSACTKEESAPVSAMEPAAAPTNRVDIPPSVRAKLGITFAKVEYRDVARTLRLPGRFELLPSARREYRAPLEGRVVPLVEEYQEVAAGTPLYRLESAAWRELGERISALEALVASMGALRDAHRVHEQSLVEKVALWRERVAALEALREAGGADTNRLVEASATLIATRADLAEIMEKDAELEARQRTNEAELRALVARREFLLRTARADGDADPAQDSLVIRALDAGVVASLPIPSGGAAAEDALVAAVLRPEAVRFRARGLQADLPRLRPGLPARIVSASGDAGTAPLPGELILAPTADADSRTIDLLLLPSAVAAWARAGVVAQLEITLEGGEADLAIPLAAVTRDGGAPILFRRDPANPDKAIRIDADLGVSDGRWVVVRSGLREGDEIVLAGNYQLMLATSGAAPKGGHFHADGTWHEGEH